MNSYYHDDAMNNPSSLFSFLASVAVLAFTASSPSTALGEEAKIPVLVKSVLVEIHQFPDFELALVPNQARPESSDDLFLRAQYEIMTAPAVLDRMIDRLDLANRWGGVSKEEARARLHRTINVVRLDERSAVFNVSATDSDAESAASLAEGVVQSYADYRIQTYRERVNGQLNALEQEIRSQEDLVEEKRKLFHTIMKAVQAPYIEDRNGEDLREDVRETVREATDKIFIESRFRAAELQRDYAVAQAETNAWLELGTIDFTRCAEGSGKYERLWRLHEELTDAQDTLEKARKGGGNEPDLQLQESLVERSQAAFDRHLGSVRRYLRLELDVRSARIKEMEKMVDVHRFHAVDQALQWQDVVEARRDYEAGIRLLESMKELHARGRIAFKLPLRPLSIHGIH